MANTYRISTSVWLNIPWSLVNGKKTDTCLPASLLGNKYTDTTLVCRQTCVVYEIFIICFCYLLFLLCFGVIIVIVYRNIQTIVIYCVCWYFLLLLFFFKYTCICHIFLTHILLCIYIF